MKGVDDLYRFRVDHYRIVYAIEDKLLLMLVVTVGHRKDVYQKLSKKYDREAILSMLREEP